MADASTHIFFATVADGRVSIKSYEDGRYLSGEPDYNEPEWWLPHVTQEEASTWHQAHTVHDFPVSAEASRIAIEQGYGSLVSFDTDAISPLLIVDNSRRAGHFYLKTTLALTRGEVAFRYISGQELALMLFRAQARGWSGTVTWRGWLGH